MSLAEVARLVGGELVGKDAVFEGLQVDSREIVHRHLFCAIKGERVDGHEYVANAMRQGAAGALVERDPMPPDLAIEEDPIREKFVREGFKLIEEKELRP